MCWNIEISLQKSVEKCFVQGSDHVCAKEPLLQAQISENFHAVMTAVRKEHKVVFQIIAEILDCARNLPEFGARNNFTGDCSWSGARGGNVPGSATACG